MGIKFAWIKKSYENDEIKKGWIKNEWIEKRMSIKVDWPSRQWIELNDLMIEGMKEGFGLV